MDIENKEQPQIQDAETHRLEAEKTKARTELERSLKTLGNLNDAETRELVAFEFDKGAETLDEQLRRYYLKLKNEKPDKAEQMLAELEEVKLDETTGEDDIDRLCGILRKYWSGFVIHHGGKRYTS